MKKKFIVLESITTETMYVVLATTEEQAKSEVEVGKGKFLQEQFIRDDKRVFKV